MTLLATDYTTLESGSAVRGAARFEALDSLRGVAALMVALFHFPAAGWLSANSFVRGSFLFVDFFFVLSGFVIAHAYFSRLSTSQGLARFMVTRIGRLLPLHLFMLLAFVAFELLKVARPDLFPNSVAFTDGYSTASLVGNAFLIHGLGFFDQLTWNAPSWSISTEMMAYLAFGSAVFAFGRRSAGFFAVLLVICPLILFKFSPDFMDATSDLGLVRCLYGFAAGVLAQMLFARSGDLTDHLGESRLAYTFAELLTIIVVIMFVGTAAPHESGLLAPFVFGIALLVFAKEGGHVSQMLKTGPMLLIGTISYSIYMTHLFIQYRMINTAAILAKRFDLELFNEAQSFQQFNTAAAIPATLLMTGLVVLCSWVTYRLIELPARDYFRRLAAKI